jgi:hypothetical protein
MEAGGSFARPAHDSTLRTVYRRGPALLSMQDQEQGDILFQNS